MVEGSCIIQLCLHVCNWLYPYLIMGSAFALPIDAKRTTPTSPQTQQPKNQGRLQHPTNNTSRPTRPCPALQHPTYPTQARPTHSLPNPSIRGPTQKTNTKRRARETTTRSTTQYYPSGPQHPHIRSRTSGQDAPATTEWATHTGRRARKGRKGKEGPRSSALSLSLLDS